jgi:hypothetical protein
VVSHFGQPNSIADEEQIVKRAIHGYFARRAKIWQSKLHQLVRRGLISLVIGLAFLGVFFVTGRTFVRLMGDDGSFTEEKPLAQLGAMT